ncbi:MAG: thiamine diphosphokinase [Oscillospiraceae bacterium]|jgi:thiamine pyrophosphokinase|nr:thiamine diphosphokinase [Oscillospiraceae bacterium]
MPKCEKPRRCVICGAGPVNNAGALLPLLRPQDFIIAADKGLRLIERLKLNPDLIVADFDSLQRKRAMRYQVPVVELPVKKDDTDTMAAARLGLERGFKDFLLLGASGGRLDHTMANFAVMLFLLRHGAKAMLADEKNIVRMVLPGRVVIEPVENSNLSLLAYAGDVCGLSVRHAVYELENAVLTPDFPLGVSNSFKDNANVEITFRQGILIIIISKD